MTDFKVILADPPWEYTTWSTRGRAKSPDLHYPCMALPEIQRLPVRRIARPGGCLLALWTPCSHLYEALSVLTAWGFDYTTCVPWIKVSKTGTPAPGLGYAVRSCSEILLIGSLGACPVKPGTPRPLGAILAPRRGHSVKPEAQYALCESWPGPYVELFARHRRDNWVSLGNEVQDGLDIRCALADLIGAARSDYQTATDTTLGGLFLGHETEGERT